MTTSKPIKLQIGVALFLLLLGIGNLFFGQYKMHQYSKMYQEATREIYQVSDVKKSIPMFDSSPNITMQLQYITKLKSRLEFYNFVILGGKLFLAISGVIFLFSLITIKQQS